MPTIRARRVPRSGTGRGDAALADAAPVSYWLDRADRPEEQPPLQGDTTADLVVVGAGFSGLWAALLAAERRPGARIVVLEAATVAWAASGRNGGFCEASLTHGEANGRSRWPEEMDRLDALGRANLDAIGAFATGPGRPVAWERTGSLTVATADWQVAELEPDQPGFLDAAAVRAELDSPTYLAGRWERDDCALVDPVALAWKLRDAALEAGVVLHERTAVTGLEESDGRVAVATGAGTVRADRVVLGTNAFRPLLARLRPFVVPVYDHVLVTEPLGADRLASLGWARRQGVADAGNRFHYYRLTPDDRILWGGFEATYHFGRRVRPAYDSSPAVWRLLADHFAETFPQLEGIRFTHRWGGAIDTCSRFCAFFGTALGGRVAYSLGYTGLGVGATRFGAEVALDLLEGAPTERTELRMMRTRPVPFPPEPLAWAAVTATRASLAHADDHGGRRNAWLRLLDRFGVGFDS